MTVVRKQWLRKHPIIAMLSVQFCTPVKSIQDTFVYKKVSASLSIKIATSVSTIKQLFSMLMFLLTNVLSRWTEQKK